MYSVWLILISDELPSDSMCSKGLGVSSTCQVDNFHWSDGIYSRTGKFEPFVFNYFQRSFVFLWLLSNTDICIFLQYINPIVKNSQHPLKGNLLYAIERVLKLSVPNLYVWLCMFYCFFHLWYVWNFCFVVFIF